MRIGKGALVFFVVLSCGLLLAQFSAAQDYPKRDIRHIIPWSAGGGTDAAMRGFMHYAEQEMPVKIYNENITGAQSGIGVFELMNARPDGYTVGTLTWDSVITVPYNKLVPGYDLSKLSYICTATIHPTALVVGADSPWKSLKEFIEAAKAQPGKLTVSNVGTGGVWHLPALDMMRKTGIEVRHVPYPKGSGPQREALLSGETDAASMSIAAALPSLKAGKARVLAVMADERDPLLPDVPTFLELGYDVVWGSFRLVAVPAGTPQDRQEILEAAFKKVFDNAKFQEWEAKTGLGATWKNSQQTVKYIEGMKNKAFELIDELVQKGLLKM